MPPEKALASPEVPDFAGLQIKTDALLDRYAETMAAVVAGSSGPDLARRMSHLTAAFRELRTQLHRAACDEVMIEEAVTRAVAGAKVPAQRPRRPVPGPRPALVAVV